MAIGEAIEAELQGRNGIRHDTKPAKENFPEVAGQTRDLAAKAAGLVTFTATQESLTTEKP